jgi:calnexin
MRVLLPCTVFAVLCFTALVMADLPTEEGPYTVPAPKDFLFYETFQENWSSRWIVSDDEDFDGEWSVEAGPALSGIKEEVGLVVNSPAKKHAISSVLPQVVTVEEDNLVVQYEVRLHNSLNCGGAYMKLLRNTEDMFTPEEFNSQSDYVIMFGPDKCGSNNKIHFIFKHKNPITGEFEEKHLKNPPSFSVDTESHLYTLIIKKDNSFEIFVDQKSVRKGSLLNDFDPAVNPPEMIDDPSDHKPSDWVDEAQIPDPEATKPNDWDEEAPRHIRDPDAQKPSGWLDDAPAQVPDPDAKQPEDWDDELDGEWEAPLVSNPVCEKVGCGEWEAPMINNPAYKGMWSPPMIDNPAYKGPWEARQIPNPNFFVDEHPHNLSPIVAVGFEIWTMQDGIQFDNIYIGRDPKVAHAWAQETFVAKSNAERAEKKAEEKRLKQEKIENQKKNGLKGKFEAYGEIAGDFIAENPIPVFISIVAVLIGMVVLFEYRRPKNEEVEEDTIEPEQAQELLRKLKEKLEKEGKLAPEDHKENEDSAQISNESEKPKSD